MKTQIEKPILIIIACLITVLIPLGIKAQPQENERPNLDRENNRRLTFIKQADFYLRNDQFVTGKLIEEDKNKIIVEQLQGSELIVMTYSKREVDTRTVKISTLPEHRYYVLLGDYFASRTWDFRDDTDDFILAIRSYEKAKLSATETQRRESDIQEIQDKIDKVKADKKIWAQQVADRAELKKKEFQATFDDRMKELEKQIQTTNNFTREVSQNLDNFMNNAEQNFENLAKNLENIENNNAHHLSFLEKKIDENRELIKDYNRYYYEPRYYYRNRRR